MPKRHEIEIEVMVPTKRSVTHYMCAYCHMDFDMMLECTLHEETSHPVELLATKQRIAKELDELKKLQVFVYVLPEKAYAKFSTKKRTKDTTLDELVKMIKTRLLDRATAGGFKRQEIEVKLYDDATKTVEFTGTRNCAYATMNLIDGCRLCEEQFSTYENYSSDSECDDSD